MRVVPLPAQYLPDTWEHWSPWISKICERSKDDLADVVRDLRDGRKQVHLLWDPEEEMCRGILGTELLVHSTSGEKTCHLIWATGPGIKTDWASLLQQIQDYAREHLGCSRFKATARLGWKSLLRRGGFRFSHVIAEKDL